MGRESKHSLNAGSYHADSMKNVGVDSYDWLE